MRSKPVRGSKINRNKSNEKGRESGQWAWKDVEMGGGGKKGVVGS